MCMIHRWIAYGPEGFRGLSNTLRSRVRFRQRLPPDSQLHASGGKPKVTPSSYGSIGIVPGEQHSETRLSQP